MTNLFSYYRLIDVQNIIRKNIHPDNIEQDLISLLSALNPFKFISRTEDGSALDRSFSTKLSAKSGVVDLLSYFGYTKNNTGVYIYRSPQDERERQRREDGINEFQKFFTQLKNIQNGDFIALEDFLQSNATALLDETPLPDSRTVNNGNVETLELVKSFKGSIVTSYGTPPGHGFIRRKLAKLLLKQKCSNSINITDDKIDQIISDKIFTLRDNDGAVDVPRTDHVYIECLIRADFDMTNAFEILRHNRPNLEVPPEPAVPEVVSKTSIDNVKEPLISYYRLLVSFNNNKKQLVRQQSVDVDKWEQLSHIIPAIQQIRQTNNLDEHFSRIYRLLYSESLNIIGQQPILTIEILASLLCELPIGALANLDMVTIKNILSSGSSGIHDDFRAYALSLLSVDCEICFESYPRSQMETMLLCSHKCCLGCLKEYYRNNVNNINTGSVNILTCCFEHHEITNETHQTFFTCLEAKLKRWFRDEPEFLERYHDKIFHATSGKQIKSCGSSQCTGSFYADDNEEVAAVRCPHCQFYQCALCCKKWNPAHKNITCEEYTDWLFENDEDDPEVQAWKFISRTGIKCPNKDCQQVFDYKPGGCEHFQCDTCKTHFCRMCSALYYFHTKDPKCSIATCILKTTMHAHCPANCFRETRIGTIETITELLEDNDIDIEEELEKQAVSEDGNCAVEDCVRPVIDISDNRFCETCYKQFLCSLVWNRQLRPWAIYEDNNLVQILAKASIPVPPDTPRDQLIQLCNQHLNTTLGKPSRITRQRV